MKKATLGGTLSALVTVVALMFIFVYIPTSLLVINKFGIETEVTVSFSGKKRMGIGGSSSYRNVSFGYYSVSGKKYKAYALDVLPVGSTFKIKYNPIWPSRYNNIKENE